MKIKSLILFLLLGIHSNVFAQIDYSLAFQQKLEAGHLMFIEPIDGKYKDIPIFINEYCKIDLAIKNKKEKIEVRYAIKTDTESHVFNAPQIRTMQLLSNVATNQQSLIVAIHRLDKTQIEKEYNADWGAIAYFSPKVKFAYKDHCKLLVLHKDDVATVFVFFLFDKPTEELENLMSSIRFKDVIEEDTF